MDMGRKVSIRHLQGEAGKARVDVANLSKLGTCREALCKEKRTSKFP